MKKIYQIIYSVFLVSLLPFSLVAGQTKNPERKIKIIISDDSGKRVIIDTLLKDSQIKDSIILKDGNLIITGHSGEVYRIRPHEGDDHRDVYLSSNYRGTGNRYREITIVRSDPAVRDETGNDQEGSTDDKTRYVIAKDGMVVTVEGNDEARVKGLIKEIEKNLGVKNDNGDKNSLPKVETNKK